MGCAHIFKCKDNKKSVYSQITPIGFSYFLINKGSTGEVLAVSQKNINFVANIIMRLLWNRH